MKKNSIEITIGYYNGIGPKCVELALKKLNLRKNKIFVIGDNAVSYTHLTLPTNREV